jgi:hypothetical protein
VKKAIGKGVIGKEKAFGWAFSQAPDANRTHAPSRPAQRGGVVERSETGEG